MTRRPTDSRSTAATGRAFVMSELERRGVVVREMRDGQRAVLELLGPDAAPRARIIVKTRRSGTWQVQASDGSPSPARSTPPTYWAFVDLAVAPPEVYVAPDEWVRRDIHEAHREYLERHGGRRAENDASNHHALGAGRIEEWRGKWELLGIALPKQGAD